MTSRLKELRTEAGLTQQGLADKAGINIRLLQKYESGEYDIDNMTVRTAKAIAAALDIRILDLVEGCKMTAKELAKEIREAETWSEVKDKIRELCRMAGIEDKWEAADGEDFEEVIYEAASILEVEVY